MIHIQIIQSPDHNILCEFKYEKNLIYLGSKGEDLCILDEELYPMHVLLEVVDDKLLIHPQKEVEFFRINGKRATSIKKIKPNDLIEIGKTTFKIIQFSQTFIKSKKEILDKKLNQLIEENSPLLSIIESLTKAMENDNDPKL